MVTEEAKDLGKRIDQVCAENGLNYNKLAKVLDISSTTFYQISAGRTKQLSIDVLIKFYHRLGIDIAWLVTGEGRMYSESPDLSTKTTDKGSFGDKIVEQLESRVEELKDQVDNLKYTVNLQRKMLEQSEREPVNVGKTEGVDVRPLSFEGMSFEEGIQLYKQIGKSLYGYSAFFLQVPEAKLLALR